MIVRLRWLGIFTNFCLFILLVLAALNYQTSLYLISQAKGQLSLLMNTRSLEEFVQEHTGLTEKEKNSIRLIEQVKAYSVDSLGYRTTDNFTKIYDQRGKPVLWVITACEPYTLKPYEWTFPVVGRVSYKGFFEKDKAEKEFTHLLVSGYDVDLRSVSAWSTLGWFSDPVLSSMLQRSKGSLCNLLFHELFHATYYAPSSVDFNENVASFVAHKATLRFLQQDSAALNDYLRRYQDAKLFNTYMLNCIEALKAYYPGIRNRPDKYELKLRRIADIARGIEALPLRDKKRYTDRGDEILKSKNAYFVDFVQYDSMQDSLEKVFNKFYGGDLEKMVQDLKLN